MKRIFAVALALLMALSASLALAAVPEKPSTFSYAYDLGAGVLSDSDIAQMARLGAQLEDETGIQVIAVAVDFLGGMPAEDYATDLINTWGIGSKERDDGVLVLLSRGDREVFIGTGTGVDRIMTGAACDDLIEQNIDDFAADRFSQGLCALYADVCEYLATAQGKTLSAQGATAPMSADSDGSSYERATSGRSRASGGGFLDILLGLIVLYVIISVLVNAFSRGNGCLNMFFLGWLFGGNDRRRRPPRPPMGGGFGGPRPPRPPMGGGFGGPRPPRPPMGGGFGGTRPPRPPMGGGSDGGSRGFGGGRSRGGGAGRRF